VRVATHSSQLTLGRTYFSRLGVLLLCDLHSLGADQPSDIRFHWDPLQFRPVYREVNAYVCTPKSTLHNTTIQINKEVDLSRDVAYNPISQCSSGLDRLLDCEQPVWICSRL